MTRLSVNINKVASIRNARGGNTPNLLQIALDCESFGADGITVHPRPDERHIRYQDVRDLKKHLTKEFNVEGFPSSDFLDLVLEVGPDQATLVPDEPGAITSDSGWDVLSNKEFLKGVVSQLNERGIRVSLFVGTELNQIEAAAEVGADRIELYTGPYAEDMDKGDNTTIEKFKKAGERARDLGLGLNAGHDLNLKNLNFFARELPYTDEVSIGHALISDALYFGLEETISRYKKELIV